MIGVVVVVVVIISRNGRSNDEDCGVGKDCGIRDRGSGGGSNGGDGVVNIELIDGFVFSYFWYMASFMGRRKEDGREKWKSAKVKV